MSDGLETPKIVGIGRGVVYVPSIPNHDTEKESAPMTTDHDLLADITQKHAYHSSDHTQIVLINGCVTCKVYSALRAVVELHKPFNIEFNRIQVEHCRCFDFDGTNNLYPCPTIQAIEGQLK